MHRRDLLKLLGVMVLSYSIGSRTGEGHGRDLVRSKRRIVVIGAGLAGLAAARELQTRGHDVVVVEARDRIGGRIWTSTVWPDLPVDLGATWIHGVRGNPLTDLAEAIQAKRLVTSYDRAVTYNTDGQSLSAAEATRLDELRGQVFRALKLAKVKDTDASVQHVIEPLMRQLENTSEALGFLTSFWAVSSNRNMQEVLPDSRRTGMTARKNLKVTMSCSCKGFMPSRIFWRGHCTSNVSRW